VLKIYNYFDYRGNFKNNCFHGFGQKVYTKYASGTEKGIFFYGEYLGTDNK